MVFRIDDGRSGATRLDGLKFALVIRSGKVMADGDWIFGQVAVVDEAAPIRRSARRFPPSPAARRAARLRSSGRTWSRISAASSISRSSSTWRAADLPRPDPRSWFRFEIEGEASRNRSGDPYYLDNVGHPASRRLALARSKETRIHAFGLDLDMAGEGNNGHFAPFSWAA